MEPCLSAYRAFSRLLLNSSARLLLLNPELIESIDVLKGKEAEKQYSGKGKKWLIRITTQEAPSL